MSVIAHQRGPRLLFHYWLVTGVLSIAGVSVVFLTGVLVGESRSQREARALAEWEFIHALDDAGAGTLIRMADPGARLSVPSRTLQASKAAPHGYRLWGIRVALEEEFWVYVRKEWQEDDAR